MVPPILFLAFASRISNDERSVGGFAGGVHKVAQVPFVKRRTDDEVGDGAEVGQVEQAVVSCSVFAHKSGSVDANYKMQLLNGHVVDNIIVSPLHKRRVDVAEWNHSLLGKSGGEGHGVPLGDADVESSSRKSFHHMGHGASGRHGRSDTHNSRIGGGKLNKRMAEDILIQLRLVEACKHNPLAGFFVELTRRVPFRSRILGGLKSLALFSFEMKKLRPLHILNIIKDADNTRQVVPVGRTEAADTESLEKIMLAGEQSLQTIIEAEDKTLAIVVDQMHLPHTAVNVVAKLIIRITGRDIHQILAHGPHAPVDRHIIIVKNDQ